MVIMLVVGATLMGLLIVVAGELGSRASAPIAEPEGIGVDD
ncbi:MAG TPA: hypothetical protein VKA37_12920 [Halobacteriales archaeon]|nr:hypothetical protein [Halobacteriales archaeon]